MLRHRRARPMVALSRQAEPVSSPFNPEQQRRFDEQFEKAIAKYPAERRRSALLAVMHLAQDELGWLSEPAMAYVGWRLDVPPVRVREVATFYTMYRLRPVGRHHIVDEVVKSNLRGRGGAGFPTGMKWTFVRKETSVPKYLVVNADEGEPGTFKDRELLLRSPHRFLEGLVIGCYALDCHLTYVYCRGEFRRTAAARVQQAIDEAYANGFLGKNILGSGFDLDAHVVNGAGAYICGEETAMLESIEGRKGYPRLKPPFPANAGGGLFKQPTAVNNVETLANLPVIVEKGGEWFANVGVPKNGGTRLFAVSGHVNKPGVHEAPMGTTFRVLLDEYCGGVGGGQKNQ